MRTYLLTLAILMVCGNVIAANKILDRQMPLRNNEANELFHQQKYDEALKSYLDLYGQDTGDGALAYNIGNTYAAMGDMEKASEFFQKAISAKNSEASNRARFNLGNLQMANQKMQDAVKQYADYLRANPDDQDAKRNLEVALKMMEQQQQQQQQNQDQQDQENQDQENQDQQQQQSQDGQSEENQDQQNQDQQSQDQQDQQNQQNKDQQDQQDGDQNQNQQDQQDQEEKDQQDQQDQKDKEDQQQQQQQQAQEGENQDKMDESMKQQILEALSEQEKKQQKEYQKRKLGPQRRRAKDW